MVLGAVAGKRFYFLRRETYLINPRPLCEMTLLEDLFVFLVVHGVVVPVAVRFLDECNSGPSSRFPGCRFRSLETCDTPLRRCDGHAEGNF